MEVRVHKPPRKKPIGGLIQCHDCGKVGHIYFRGLSPELSPGWAMAWVWLRPLYTCPACGRKRVERVLRAIRK